MERTGEKQRGLKAKWSEAGVEEKSVYIKTKNWACRSGSVSVVSTTWKMAQTEKKMYKF